MCPIHFCSTNYTTGHDLNSNASLDMALKTVDPNMILGQVCSSSFLLLPFFVSTVYNESCFKRKLCVSLMLVFVDLYYNLH